VKIEKIIGSTKGIAYAKKKREGKDEQRISGRKKRKRHFDVEQTRVSSEQTENLERERERKW